MPRKRRVYRSAVLALSALLLSSCGEQSGPTTFKVTGKVTMDGSPVPEAVVVLYPKNKSEDSMLASQAITDAEGLFEMRTHLEKDNYKDGMQPGAYVVTVTKLELPRDMRRKPKNLLPKKYSLARTSNLTAHVTSTDDNHFEFSLEK